MEREVCYERLRPRQAVAAREACAAAYLPIGTIEWHGVHNPLGCDGISAHALAVHCARAGGGLVFPTLWYGESREEGLMEVGAADRDRIVAEMSLPPGSFAPGYMRFTAREQYENYQRLLLHCLFQIRSLGFKVITIVAGHYPLIDHARAACSLFHQSRWNGKRAEAITWAFTGHELVLDIYPQGGDHSGYWETSLLLAMRPEMTDLSELPRDESAPVTGVISARPVQQADVEFGRKALDAIVERVVAQVRDRLVNPRAYYDHGIRL